MAPIESRPGSLGGVIVGGQHFASGEPLSRTGLVFTCAIVDPFELLYILPGTLQRTSILLQTPQFPC
jgi:hypothetical protein